jgi:2-polyprenyl-3-methyl-5-hydroxy-6-metoxy-1,4-benzoquinol methylase
MNPDEAHQPIHERYGFNPFQFSIGDDALRDFHRRQVSFFVGCHSVLDLGAGRGLFLDALRASGITGVGVESHRDSADALEANGNKCFRTSIQEFFQREEFRSILSTIDGVYCCHVVEHLDPEEVFELLRDVREKCAPNVRMRIITNNPADPSVLGSVFWMDLTHKRLYPGSLLAAMARSQGFTRTEFQNFLGMRLGKRDRVQRLVDRLLLRRDTYLPNVAMDCR